MYKNIGRKIKGLAKFICAAGITGSVLWGIASIIIAISAEDIAAIDASLVIGGIIAGLIVTLIGSLVSWLSSLCLYGFGELIEKTTEIAENTHKEIPQE